MMTKRKDHNTDVEKFFKKKLGALIRHLIKSLKKSLSLYQKFYQKS